MPDGLRWSSLWFDGRCRARWTIFGLQLNPYLCTVDATFNVGMALTYRILKPLQIDRVLLP
jgi:hypothetical protein